MESNLEQEPSEHQEAHQRSGLGERNVLCHVCRTGFRREGDRARHKCALERRRPVSEQEGSVQCEVCFRTWKGELLRSLRNKWSAGIQEAGRPQEAQVSTRTEQTSGRAEGFPSVRDLHDML